VKKYLRAMIVSAFCLMLAACGKQDHGGSSGSGQSAKVEVPEKACVAYQKAVTGLNRQLTEFEKGVFYAYYCD